MSAQRYLRFTAAAIILSATLCAQPPQGGRGGPQPEFMRQAQQALRDGKLDDALGVYQKELATNPNSVPANNAAGTVLDPVSYTHLRAHETRHDLVCRLLLEKKKK